jgi:hypothetical protein
MNVWRNYAGAGLLAAALVAACSSEAPPSKSASGGSPASSAASAPPSATGRVFFIEPRDGATVKSPVHLRFGIEKLEIMPVPQGDVETVRPGVGHHHVAVDADCLPPGTVIPKAAPWVHFGDGKNEIDMQLPPGQHKLTLEIGDDKHTTMPGFCQTITVNVAS